MNRNIANSRGLRRAGFTLIELLAAIAILGLLLSLAVPMISKARASGNLTACRLNLHSLAGTLQLWVDERNKGNWPPEQGPKFLLVLVRDKEITGKDCKVFNCPGTDDVTYAADDSSHSDGSGFKDWDSIDKNCMSYAGRDNRNFRLNKNKLGEEAIASDDNDGRPNHNTQTNIVYGDGRVESVDIKDYASELPENAQWIPVGPESPDPDLKKLLIE